MTPLRQRMIEDLKLRNLSPHTQEAYVRAVIKMAQHFGKSPDLLEQGDVRAYLVHLAEKSLPVVLSREEVAQFLAAVRRPKYRALFMTTYAAGLRVSEVVRLRVEDIESRRMVIRVRQGKGKKDRYVMLSPKLLAELRAYWRIARPTEWLFPGRVTGRPLSRTLVGLAIRRAARRAGLRKTVTPHTLRHVYS